MKIKVLHILQTVALLALILFGVMFACSVVSGKPEWGWTIAYAVPYFFLQWSDQQPGFFLRDDYYII